MKAWDERTSTGWLLTYLFVLSGCGGTIEDEGSGLLDFEIVGLSVDSVSVAPGESIQARALVYGGVGFFSPQAPSFRWELGGVSSTEPLALISAPTIVGDYLLGVEVTNAAGDVHAAEMPIQVVDPGQDIAPPEGLEVTLEEVTALSATELMSASKRGLAELLEATERADWSTEAAVFLEVDRIGRLSIQLDDLTDRFSTRWRVSNGAGDLLELTSNEADWVPFDVMLEGNKAVWTADVESGHFGVVGIVSDAQHASDWALRDLVVGSAGDTSGFSWVEHDGRWLETDALLADDVTTVAATLIAADTPSGIALTEVEESGTLEMSDPTGVKALDCPMSLPVAYTFQLDWLSEGWCGLDDVVGARLIIGVSRAFTP